jgi:DNA-binding NtrC family response regulator
VVVQLGGVTTVVQSSPTTTRLRHVRSHDYFEGRLEDECARAELQGGSFGVARIKFRAAQAQLLEDALTRHLGSLDVVGMYAADEYELLLVDMVPDQVRETCLRIQAQVTSGGSGDLTLGIASWSRDGRSPEALLGAAGSSPVAMDPRGSSSIPGVGAIEGLRPLLERIAPTQISVLILGETGVGKEVLARRLHQMSPRAGMPMLCINCAALPEPLLESELFGHERGAFTGAVEAKAGLLETAQGGTVMLDEIAELPLTLQAKLLRVVEERQVTRVGGVRPRSIEVRFITATNRDLEAEVARGQFRQDLFFRLNGILLVLPPLRERVAEIEPLAELFIAEFARQNALPCPPRWSRAAVRVLERYAWPGNVRELRNVVERAVMLCEGSTIDLGHLPLERLGRTLALERVSQLPPTVPPNGSSQPAHPSPGSYGYGACHPTWHGSEEVVCPLEQTVSNMERTEIQRALERCGGNQTQAARLLGISRRSLITRIERHGLVRPRKR